MPDFPSAFSAGWGSWSFNSEDLTLEYVRDGLPAYSVQLRKITSSACMLDVIFDLKNRPWGNNEVMGDLISAFQDLFDPRVTLCGGGQDRVFDPVTHFESTNMR